MIAPQRAVARKAASRALRLVGASASCSRAKTVSSIARSASPRISSSGCSVSALIGWASAFIRLLAVSAGGIPSVREVS